MESETLSQGEIDEQIAKLQSWLDKPTAEECERCSAAHTRVLLGGHFHVFKLCYICHKLNSGD